MGFVISGNLLFLLGIPFWFIWRLIARIRTGKKKGWFFRELAYGAFYLYMLGLISLTLMPLYLDGSVYHSGSLYGNLVPILNTLHDIGRNPESLFMNAFWLRNIFGNIVAFIPFGVLFPIIFKRKGRTLHTVLYGFGLTLAIELTQLFTSYAGISYRIFDIDDIILNVIGVFIGTLLLKGMQRLLAVLH